MAHHLTFISSEVGARSSHEQIVMNESVAPASREHMWTEVGRLLPRGCRSKRYSAGRPRTLTLTVVLGVLPNYRTAEGSDLFRQISTEQKFAIATKDTFDYPSYGLAAAFAGLSQLQNDNPSFGQGLKGFARRYGSAVADQDLGNYMTEAILPSLLGEDPRYFRRGHGSFPGRAAYAASRVLVTRTDAGTSRFNTSEFLGNGIVASIGNLYYPDDTGLRYTAQRMFTQIGTDAFDNILKEFWPDVKRKWRKHRQN
jgi:hypothetical protein